MQASAPQKPMFFVRMIAHKKSLSTSERVLLWGNVSTSDKTQKYGNFLNYKYIDLLAVFPNAGRATLLVPCTPLAHAGKQTYSIVNGQPQNDRYYGIITLDITSTYIAITGSAKGTGVGDAYLDIYGIK